MYLGVDVAFNNMGWVVVHPDGLQLEAYGCIRTKREAKKRRTTVTEDDVRRIVHITKELRCIISTYQVSAVAAELPVGGSRQSNSTKALGMATAALISVCTGFKLPIAPITPHALKKGVTSRLRASKGQIARVVLGVWPEIANFKPKGLQEHITDAGGAILATRDTPVYHRAFLLAAYERVTNG